MTGQREKAAAVVRAMIFDGGLRPGDRVPQDLIASELGVSRIPVREALIILEREGWVTIEMHRGAYINSFDEDAVRDHYALYGLVYGHAGRRALARSAENLVGRLRAASAALQVAAHAREIGPRIVAFNAAVVDAAGSSRVEVVLRSMTGLVPGDFFTVVSGATDSARNGCLAVLAAVEAGDADAIVEAYATMMGAVGNEVVSVFRSRGLLET